MSEHPAQEIVTMSDYSEDEYEEVGSPYCECNLEPIEDECASGRCFACGGWLHEDLL